MTDEQYAQLGKYIVDNLNKLMAGEHRGTAVVCPMRTVDGPGMCRITIEMPTTMDYAWKDGERVPLHYTWVPDLQVYVLDEFVYKERQKKAK